MEDPSEEWSCVMTLDIDEVRMLYDHTCYSIQMWPGAPARPYEEQIYLDILKKRLFAMKMDYNLYSS
jgi:hypothetical protein